MKCWAITILSLVFDNILKKVFMAFFSKRVTRAALVLSVVVCASSASAQATYIWSGSEITGIRNVPVGGVNYDASFNDGLYSNLQRDVNGAFAYAFAAMFNELNGGYLAGNWYRGCSTTCTHFVTGNGPDVDPSVGWRGNIGRVYASTTYTDTGNSTTYLWDQIQTVNRDTSDFGWATTVSWSLSPVTAVPEPETYALVLAGFGLMGAIVRRRKQKSITA